MKTNELNLATMEDEDPLDAYMATLTTDSTPTCTTADVRHLHESTRVSLRSPSTVALARNRRFTRLQQLLASNTRGGMAEDDEYFSDTCMQQRSPALYHFHLGQYQNVESRQQRAGGSSAAEQLLSVFLMEADDRRAMETRRVAEQRTWGAYRSRDDQRDEEEEEEEDEEEDDDKVEADEGKEPELTMTERRGLLIEIMSQRFLDGCDGEYVDYAEIDANEELDDLLEMQRDAEDRYFAEDGV